MQASRFEAASVLDQPVGRLVDDRSARVASVPEGAARTPLRLLFVAYTTLTLAITGVGVFLVHSSLMAGVRNWDVSVSEWFVDHRGPGWTGYAMFWSTAADTVAIIGVALLVVIVLAVKHRWRDVLLVAGGLGLEASVFITANQLVRRERPPVPTVGAEPGTFSFPSGHVAAAIVLSGCLAVLLLPMVRNRVLRVLVWAFPVVVGVSVAFGRVYRGMHFLTDVLVGAALGVAALLVALVAARASSLADQRHHAHPEEVRR